jgi:hypothetical protein
MRIFCEKRYDDTAVARLLDDSGLEGEIRALCASFRADNDACEMEAD